MATSGSSSCVTPSSPHLPYRHSKSVSWHSSTTGLGVCTEFSEPTMDEFNTSILERDKINGEGNRNRNNSIPTSTLNQQDQLRDGTTWQGRRQTLTSPAHKRTSSSSVVPTHRVSGSHSGVYSLTSPSPSTFMRSAPSTTITTSISSQRRHKAKHSSNSNCTSLPPPPFGEYKFPNNSNSRATRRSSAASSSGSISSHNPHIFSDEETASTSASTSSSPVILDDDNNYMHVSHTNDSNSPYILSVSKHTLQDIFISLANKERQLLEAREALTAAEAELDRFKNQWFHVLNADPQSCSPRNSWYFNPTAVDSPPTSPRTSLSLNTIISPPVLPPPISQTMGLNGPLEVPLGMLDSVEIRTLRPEKVRKFPNHATFIPGMHTIKLVESSYMYEVRLLTTTNDPDLIELLKNFVLSIIELIMGIPHVAVKSVVKFLLPSSSNKIDQSGRVVRRDLISPTEHCWP